jgi:hypothetical protein
VAATPRKLRISAKEEKEIKNFCIAKKSKISALQKNCWIRTLGAVKNPAMQKECKIGSWHIQLHINAEEEANLLDIIEHHSTQRNTIRVSID